MSHKPSQKKIVCCFSASDSSGHAGLQADLRTLAKLEVHGCSVVTAITAQNSQRFLHLSATNPHDVEAQWQSIIEDSPPAVCKVGLLANAEQVDTISQLAEQSASYWIVDPVLQSSTGFDFHHDEIRTTLVSLLPHVDLITPNIPEAEALLGHSLNNSDEIESAAQALNQLGAKSVLIKGGHGQQGDRSRDYFYSATTQFWMSSQQQQADNNRGTGCVMASAIAAFIAHGKASQDAVVLAHAYVQQGLRTGYAIGKGSGPIAAGNWPDTFADYPAVSSHANYTPPSGFASCDIATLGLYPVIDSLSWLQKLLAEGVRTIQLRIKNLTGAALASTLNEAIQLGRRYDARLFINDHWQLAIEYKAYGVHLGQEDIDSADIEALRSAGIRLGISTHSEYEWARASTLRPSYIALGAVYPTQTKPAQVIGLGNLKRWVPLLQQQYPVTAIGGIKLQNIDEVLSTGVGSIALVTAITESEDYSKATQQLLHKLADR